MSTIVQIQVNVNDAKAIASLTNIENIGKRLSSTPIEIKVNAGAVDKVSKSVIQLAKEQTKQATASAKQAAAEAKVQVAQEKTKQTSNRLAAQQEKTAQSANRLATGQTKAASATQKAGTEAQKTSALTDLLGDSLGRIVAKQAAWQLIGNGIAAVKNSFVEALSTMKEVDSELATVRKVTGMTKDEMDALGESAYSTASKYGVAANEYLQNVSTFARAGYKEAAQGLGELAIKTQLVGDTDQETASQFLLSADAAWKYHGNVEKLSLALDEANTIDNNYATSIQKIAEGLPIVANVASMAGMSMEETMAMLGTITATTQESGTKAATAARALILNILGDTTTEISDGVTATEESVQSLSGILQKYAPDVVAAAEATGKLINPMEAIEALSKAAKDGLISEADLMQMVSALGGKLRTNQLLALLENFDMYKSMLADMGVAAGSADQEVSVMLDTWDAKANILKNTWTEFVSNMADTSLIKGGLDVITGLVKVLDSDFGHLVVTVAGVTAAFALISKGAVALKTGITALALAQGPLAAGTLASAAALKTLTAAMLANPLFWVAGATAVIYGIVKAVDALTVTYEEQAQILSDLESEYETTYGKGTRFDELKSRVNELTIAEQNEYNILKMRNDEAERQLQLARDAEYDKWMDANWSKKTAVSSDTFDSKAGQSSTLGADTVSKFRRELAAAHDEYAKGETTLTEYRNAILDIASNYDDLYDKLVAYKKDGREIGEDAEALIALYEFIAKKSSEIDTSGTDAVADSFEEVKNSVDAATEALQRYNAELDGLADKEANANAMQTAFNNAMKDFQAGKVSSAYVKSFYDQFIPDDIKEQFGYSVADAMEWAMSDSNLGKIFNSGDMFGAFYDVINEAAQGGSLDGIVSFDDSGAITAISSYKELAEQLGITEGMAQALAQGLSVYMDGVFYTGEEASNIVSQLGDKLGEGSHSLSDYASALSQITGQTTVEGLLSVFEGLERAGAVNWADKLGVGSAEEARSQIISTIEALLGETDDAKAKAKDPVTFDVDAEIDEANAKLAQLDEKKKTASGSVDVPVTVPGASEAQQQLDNVNQAKNNASGSVEVGADASGAAEAANELRDVGDAANEIPDSKQIHVSVRDNASGVLNVIYSRLASIRSKTVTITTIEKKYKQTASGALIPTNAGGTQNSPGGRAVVNDGAPVNGSSAELIVDNGDAYIANGGKMAIVDLSPGAKVYTAKQTQDMLTGEKEEIPMHAGGTGLVRPGGNGGVYGGDHSGGTGVGGSTASNTEEDDPLKKEVSEKLDNIDKQIELARNRNDRAKEQALQEQAAKMVRDFVQQYLNKGYSNTSNEVLDLLNRGYGYSDDLMGELVDSLEALTDSTNAANKLAEKQQAVEKARQELENAKKQRTVRIYNPVTGQWEWVAKADDILKAQENLAEAEKDYQDAKIEQELDAIKNGNIGDIGDLTMSPALRELIANASDEEQKRIADILHAISGGTKNTTDTTGESIFRSTDSHDVYYQFGDLKLSETEAKNMTVKELAEKLKTLKLT
jgi:TP901 family phage tail tape measure protein|nr:MAG TPA: minor tail protein [Caudoviricetes sp.]